MRRLMNLLLAPFTRTSPSHPAPADVPDRWAATAESRALVAVLEDVVAVVVRVLAAQGHDKCVIAILLTRELEARLDAGTVEDLGAYQEVISRLGLNRTRPATV